MRDLLHTLRRRLFEPVDIAPLVYLRIAFGSVMVWEVFRYFDHDWIDRYYDPSKLHFTFYGFDWVRPWPGDGMQWHFAALGAAAACLAAGFFYRVAATLFFLGFTYVFLLEEAHYLNHFYLVCLIAFLMIFVPAHRSCSLDVALGRVARSDLVPAWTLWLMRAQIGIPYVFGGIAKLNADWIRGEPMRMWLARRADYPVLGPFVHEEPVVWFFVVGGILLDLFIVPALLWRRTRLPALAAVAAFHLTNAWVFRIGIFPWLMLAAALIYFPPQALRKVLRLPRLPIGEHAQSQTASTPPARRPLVAGLMAAYLAVQVLVPFRHLLYPGNVHWTEEGHRFSWHMKLRGKDGEVRYTVRDPKSGKEWTVDPAKELPGWQLNMAETHPDMILQYAHHLVRRGKLRGIENVEVRARAMVTLNGRRPRPLIDPSIDLAKEKRSLWPARWILPLDEPLRRPAPVRDDERPSGRRRSEG